MQIIFLTRNFYPEYEEFLKLRKKCKQPNIKMSRRLEQVFHHVKKYSALLVTKECVLKPQ